MIAVETYIPVQCLAPKQLLNPPSNKFYNLDFHKADWPNILLALQSIDWEITLEPIPPPSSFDYFIDFYIINVSIMFPLKIPVKQKYLIFIERKILMRKRTKLHKMSSTKYNTQLIKI